MSKARSTDKERNGFTFFQSFRDAVEMTSKEEQLVLYKAIADYALDQVEPDVSTLGPHCVRISNLGLLGFETDATEVLQLVIKTLVKQPRINLKTTKKQPIPS